VEGVLLIELGKEGFIAQAFIAFIGSEKRLEFPLVWRVWVLLLEPILTGFGAFSVGVLGGPTSWLLADVAALWWLWKTLFREGIRRFLV